MTGKELDTLLRTTRLLDGRAVRRILSRSPELAEQIQRLAVLVGQAAKVGRARTMFEPGKERPEVRFWARLLQMDLLAQVPRAVLRAHFGGRQSVAENIRLHFPFGGNKPCLN